MSFLFGIWIQCLPPRLSAPLLKIGGDCEACTATYCSLKLFCKRQKPTVARRIKRSFIDHFIGKGIVLPKSDLLKLLQWIALVDLALTESIFGEVASTREVGRRELEARDIHESQFLG